MIHPKEISIQDYTYQLPDNRIALHPLSERDASKLLLYKKGIISETVYKNIHEHLPPESLLVFNDTRVIKARIRFQKPTGGIIEIFCLEPYEAIHEYSSVMNQKERVRWKCMIGGAGKWKEGVLVKCWESGVRSWELNASLVQKLTDDYVVEFSWTPADLSFAEVLEAAGDIPLPPYIKRKTEKEDTDRYQTIYARDAGSVAAPTAGLHFTAEIFKRLEENNMLTHFVTLHVGAGTFKPVKAAAMQDHEMHAEWIDVSTAFIQNLLSLSQHPVAAIGTTSLRTLESLYWMGLKAYLQPALTELQLNQWEVYEAPLAGNNIAVGEALNALLNWLKKNKLEKLFTQTQILIAPGYQFKIVNILVTNFHQPRSTLLLLVAAAIGNDWKSVYDHALKNNFRFLSYGDGCLLHIS